MFFRSAILSGRSSFISTNLRARAFSTSLAGISGKAEASLKGMVFAVTEVLGGAVVLPDSSCAMLTRGGGVRFVWGDRLALLLCVAEVEDSKTDGAWRRHYGWNRYEKKHEVNMSMRMQCYEDCSLLREKFCMVMPWASS